MPTIPTPGATLSQNDYKTSFPVEYLQKNRTPFYYYDLNLLDATLATLKEFSPEPWYKVHYAVKANANKTLLQTIAKAGLGADTVSIGEVKAAVDAGFKPSEIVFAGVGKTDDEIREALSIGVGCLNVESEAELKAIIDVARECGKKAPVALRVNPEIDAHTHHYITTGLAENKFGISLTILDRLIDECLQSEWIDFKGFHFHIGSQITDFEPFRILCERINTLMDQHPDLDIPSINVGGGLGIDYDNPDGNPIPDFKNYFQIFRENLQLRPGQELHFELGRAIVAQCGSLICKVIYVKEGVGKKFMILDGGMTALIRPALYQAHHKIENLSSDSIDTDTYDVVGPICESSDVFGTDEKLPVSHRGDLIALRSAGAYGESMSSSYNCRPLPQAVFTPTK